jgi:hypothetical protein
VSIHCRGNVFTEPLTSIDKGVHIQTHRLMGGMCEIRRRDGLRCHAVHTNFIKAGSDIQKVNTQTESDRISLLLFFFKIREVG